MKKKNLFWIAIILLVLVPGMYAQRSGSIGTNTQNFTLTINTNPANATVFVDNAQQGGKAITLQRGTYSIRVSASGYLDFTTTVTLNSNQSINVTLQPITYNLRVNANVGGADVYVNNRRTGAAGSTTSLTPGTYTIRVSAAGYQDYTTSLVLGSNQTVNAVLIPLTGKVVFNFPDRLSNVFYYVDDTRYQVNARNGVSELDLPPGTYRIRISAGGIESAPMTVRITSGGTFRINPVLSFSLEEAGQTGETKQ